MRTPITTESGVSSESSLASITPRSNRCCPCHNRRLVITLRPQLKSNQRSSTITLKSSAGRQIIVGPRQFSFSINSLHIIFNPVHALLLHQGRILAPRNNRGIAAHSPRIVQIGQSFPRTFHSHGFSTFIPRTRFNHGHRLSTATLIPRSFHFHDSSTPMNFPRSQSFHGHSTIMDFPFQRTDYSHGFATSSRPPTSRHAISKPLPICPPHHSQPLIHNFHRMTTFDSILIKKVVTEFRPKRPAKFKELMAAKELITELRRKGASYESIAEVLGQHCLPISKSAIAMFCHQVLGESVRCRRRPAKKRMPGSVPAAGEIKPPLKTHFNATPPPPDHVNGKEDAVADSHGPHIAKVELLPPGEQYD